MKYILWWSSRGRVSQPHKAPQYTRAAVAQMIRERRSFPDTYHQPTVLVPGESWTWGTGEREVRPTQWVLTLTEKLS